MRKAHLELAMPDIYWAICSENNKIYIYNKTNSLDATTGRFRVLESALPVSDDETIQIKIDAENTARYILSIKGKDQASKEAVLRKHIDAEGNASYTWDVIYDKEQVDELLKDKVDVVPGYTLVSNSEAQKLRELPSTIDKIEASSKNGNILINKQEVNVYTEPNDVVHDPNYKHTDNNFTSELKNKLDNIEPLAEANRIISVQVAADAINYIPVVGEDRVARINLSGKQNVITKEAPLSLDLTEETDAIKHFSAEQKAKLIGIESGAETNKIIDLQVKYSEPYPFASVINERVAKIDLSSKQETIDETNPLSIELVQDSSNFTRMTASQKAKLASIEDGAEKNVLTDVIVNNNSIVKDKVAQIVYESVLDKDSDNAPSVTAVRRFINSSLENNVANYVTSDTFGNNFPTVAALKSSLHYYYNGAIYLKEDLKKNDYAIVAQDEYHENKQARYIYTGNAWAFLYTISNTMTAGQQQALDSGINANLVQKLNKLPADAERNSIQYVYINNQLRSPDSDRKVFINIPTGALAQLDSVTEANLNNTIVQKLNKSHTHANTSIIEQLTSVSQLLTSAQREQINKVVDKQDRLSFTGSYGATNKVVTEDTLTHQVAVAKADLEAKIAAVRTLSYKISDIKPPAHPENMGTIFLVPIAGKDPIEYEEFIVVEDTSSGYPVYRTEMFGTTAIDLSGYCTIERAIELVDDKVVARPGYDLVSDSEWTDIKVKVDTILNKKLPSMEAATEEAQNTIEVIKLNNEEAPIVNKTVNLNIDTSRFITREVNNLRYYPRGEDLAPVSFSGSYIDLINVPNIPEEVTESTIYNWGFTKLPPKAGNNRVLKINEGKTYWSDITMDKSFVTAYDLGNLKAGTQILATDTIGDILFKILRGSLLTSINIDYTNVDRDVFVGDTFSTKGLIVYGNYDDDSQAEITNYTFTPEIIDKNTSFVNIQVENYTASIPVNVYGKVTGNFTNCQTLAGADLDEQSIALGGTYSIELEPNTGYTLSNSINIISGKDAYSSAYISGNTLYITNVTGRIVFEVRAVPIVYEASATIINGTANFNKQGNAKYQLNEQGICTIIPNSTYTYPALNNINISGAEVINYDINTGKLTFRAIGPIIINASCPEVSLKSIAIIEDSTKSSYRVGESLNLSGIRVSVEYSNGLTRNYTFGEAASLTANPVNGYVFTEQDLGELDSKTLQVVLTYTNSINSVTVNKQITLTPKAIIPDVPVSHILVEPENISLFKGQSTTISATALPENASIKTINWVSSDSKMLGLTDIGSGNTVKVEALTGLGGTDAEVMACSTDGTNIIARSKVTIADDYYIGYIDNVNKSEFRTLQVENLYTNAIARTREATDTDAEGTYSFIWTAPTLKGVFYVMMPAEKVVEPENGKMLSGGIVSTFVGADVDGSNGNTTWAWDKSKGGTHDDIIINGKTYHVYGLYFNGWNVNSDKIYMNIKVNEI